jgi:hypothetical protein
MIFLNSALKSTHTLLPDIPARFSIMQEYSPPSSIITCVILTCDITSPCAVTYCPIINLCKERKREREKVDRIFT